MDQCIKLSQPGRYSAMQPQMCRRPPRPLLNRPHGFTVVELVTVIVITGVIGAAVAPRFMSRNAFDDRGFADTTRAALHYAQKAAIAQRREVCVAFTATSITLTIAAAAANPPTPPGCAPAAGCAGNPLAGPDGVAPYVMRARGQSAYAAIPANFSFMPLGCATAGQVIGFAGSGETVTIDAATGYVR